MIINNPLVRKEYFDRYQIQEWFSFNITPWLELCHFKRGEHLCNENEITSCLYFLVEGRTKIYTTHRNGRISLIEYNAPVSIIGEMELIGTRQKTIAVQALEDCYCIMIRLHECRRQILNDPVFLLRLSQYLSERTVRNTRNFVANQAHPLEERLCAFILTAQINGCFTEPLTESSEYLGVSYRHMQRVIAKLCNANILTRCREGYQITDMNYLVEHSSPFSTV